MEKEVVVFFEGHFAKIDIKLLLQNEIDIDFNGQIIVKFLNSNGVLTAINGVNGYGTNILADVAFKDAEIYYAAEK